MKYCSGIFENKSVSSALQIVCCNVLLLPHFEQSMGIAYLPGGGLRPKTFRGGMGRGIALLHEDEQEQEALRVGDGK